MSFVVVDVEPGPAHEDGLSLRFKRAEGGAERAVAWVRYESEEGVEGRWSVFTAQTPDGPHAAGARAVQVDDSSDGCVWLVTGGAHGLALVHEATGATERVGYLVLSLRAEMG